MVPKLRLISPRRLQLTELTYASVSHTSTSKSSTAAGGLLRFGYLQEVPSFGHLLPAMQTT